MRWNIGGFVYSLALTIISSTLGLFSGNAAADTSYWVQFNYNMARSDHNISGPLVTFMGQAVANLPHSFYGSIVPYTYYDYPWFLSSLPYSFAIKGSWDPVTGNFTQSGLVVFNYTISVADFYPVGSRPPPTAFTGPVLTDSEYDDLNKYTGPNPVTVTWTQWAWAQVTVPQSTPSVAVDETATTSAGVPVTTDLSAGASGNPTSAAVVSNPAHGTISASSGTQVTYTPTACFAGTDSFQFTLANASGTSNVAKATITVTAATTAATVHLVDPFLLDAYHKDPSKIHLGPLYHVQNWALVQANGLVADNVSAAIAVVQTNDCTNDVSLTTTNGTTLLPYSPDFLTTAPAAGKPSLTIPAADLLLHNIGGVFYAAALVQAPVGAPAPSFTAPIIVTAQQGTQTTQAQMDMVPPPVVLVHGLWGDLTDLGGKDKAGGIDGLAHYLKTTSPWLNHPKLVQVLCYSKSFGFDAATDPLSGGSDPCEQTSKDAITVTIKNLLNKLDKRQIVGSRVDVVAHSMGGLAARWYASQDSYTPRSYRKLRDRQQGKFHEVITLDTPELGSPLAHFLDNHSNCTAQHFSVTWNIFCRTVFSKTVAQCFAGQGRPLAAPGYPLTSGAVYSLYPHGPALQNPNLSGPNIAGANWDAVSAIEPDNSALEYLLNNLISAIYPQKTADCSAPGTAPTINQILKDPMNDAIVTVSSQTAGVKAGQSHTFQGLSHTGLPISIPGHILSNANVLASPEVNQLVCSWLSPGSTCPASLAASVAQVSTSVTSPTSKNTVPMPHIVTDNQYYVDRLTFRMPTGLELGTPFDLAVNTGSDYIPEIHVVQTDKNFSTTGSSREVPVAISHVDGHTVHLSVTPEFFGNTGFQVVAAYRDGGVAFKDFTTTVNLPSQPPTQFHADEFSDTGIRIDLDDNSSVRLHPWAIYPKIPGQVYLDTRYVSYSIAPANGPPVVTLDPNGVVHGLRPGTATIIARFGALTDQVRVTVHADTNH